MAPTEPQPDESGASPVSGVSAKTRKALSRLKRELSEEELGTTGVQKMLIAEVERLDEENNALIHYRDRYYEAATKLAVSFVKLNEKRAAEIISTACIAIGGVVLGYVPALSEANNHSRMGIIVGAVLIVAGIAAKVVRQL
jgi:hypothetical protein